MRNAYIAAALMVSALAMKQIDADHAMVDFNGDGVVDSSEWGYEMADQVFALADANGDDVLTYGELATAMYAHLG